MYLLRSNGATSLLLGSDPNTDHSEIAKLSSRDADSFGEYEAQLNSFCDVIDPLLDSSPADLERLLHAGMAGKLSQLLLSADTRPLRKAAKAAAKTDVSALYELITSPSKKVNEMVLPSKNGYFFMFKERERVEGDKYSILHNRLDSDTT